MSTAELVLVIGSLLAATLAFIFVAFRLGKTGRSTMPADVAGAADADVEHIFNDEFREELRNRGRLQFEKIISENAMFFQQDLRLTSSQLNEYLKTEVGKKLEAEFSSYEQSIADAKDMATQAIAQTQTAIEQQRKEMSDQLAKELTEEKARIIKRFEENMGEIVNHYILTAIGDVIDLNDQMPYVLSEMEANKESMMKDINNAG